MNREQLIEKAATEVFEDGAVAVDTFIGLSNEGCEAITLIDEIEQDIERALTLDPINLTQE
jgi:hypothetical protein